MNEDFSLGKMSADARLTATFKYYEKTEQNGKIERLWRSLEKMTTTNLNSIEIFRNNYNNYIPHSASNTI